MQDLDECRTFILHPSSFILQLRGDFRPCGGRATLTFLALSVTPLEAYSSPSSPKPDYGVIIYRVAAPVKFNGFSHREDRMRSRIPWLALFGVFIFILSVSSA